METIQTTEQKMVGLNQRIRNELGRENLNNLNLLSQTIEKTSLEAGVELHLLLVGGMVKPEKQGRCHKDVDLLVYCPSLATEYYTGGSHEKFDKFADFFKKVNKKLEWKMEIESPWFMDYETAGDGKVILSANQGVPIEILPTREDCLHSSFKEYLKSERNPYEVIF